MFMRVDLPAPFSPRRAWTSPLRRSKLTSSFATTPGNLFVIPRSSRSVSSAIAPGDRGAGRGPPLDQSLPHFLGDLDLPGRDLVDLRLRLLDGVRRRVRTRL